MKFTECARRKDEASTTKQSAAVSAIAVTIGVSVFPAAIALIPERFNISVASVTTVVLPFVPVTAQRGRVSHLLARSPSSLINTPTREAASKIG